MGTKKVALRRSCIREAGRAAHDRAWMAVGGVRDERWKEHEPIP